MGRGAGLEGHGITNIPRETKERRIRVYIGGGFFEAMLNETSIATTLLKQLPISSVVNRWGDEIYFDVPVNIPNTNPTRKVGVGDIAYWPEGPCLCLFFGKTPASKGNEPRPASDVTIIGHTDEALQRLRAVKEGTSILIDHASPREDSTI